MHSNSSIGPCSCSELSGLELLALGDGIRLGVRAGDSRSGSEVLLGLSSLVSSNEESIGS